MPNWCVNTLTVSGNAKQIAKFKKKALTKVTDSEKGIVRVSDFSFEPFLPMPKQLENMTSGFTTINGKEYTKWITKNGVSVGLEPADLAKIKAKCGYDGWYDRNCNVLGTKWDVEGSLDEEKSNDQVLVYHFDSAWAPPMAGILKISEQFKGLALLLEYDEPGMDFAGVYEVKNGDEIIDQQGKSLLNQ